MKKTVHFNEKIDADLLEFIEHYGNFSALCKKALRNEMNKNKRRKKSSIDNKPKQTKAKKEKTVSTRVVSVQTPPVKPFINPNIKR